MLCATTALAAPAAPARPHFTRPTTAPAAAALSERAKPIAQVAAGQAPPAPDVSLDRVLAIPGLTSKPRGDREQILVELVQSTPDSDNDKPKLYFELAQLYASQHRAWRLEAGQQTDARQVQQAERRAKDYLLKAVKTFKALTENDAFRSFNFLDTALFEYGYTLQSARYVKEARAEYDKLLKNFPSSPFVPQAHLVFADYYFDNQQMSDAEARYQAVLKYPKSDVYHYALYKLGVALVVEQRFGDAVTALAQAAKATASAATGSPDADLHRAALAAFAVAYAEVGTADAAFEALRELDEPAALDSLAALADRFAARGRRAEAIAAYQDLMKRAPRDHRVCAWQYGVARTATGADQVREIESLARLWTVLAHVHQLPADDAAACHDGAAALAGELARAYHADAASTASADSLANADKLYRVYAEVFDDAADRDDMRAFAAEVAWARAEAEPNARMQAERWETAAIAFGDVVRPLAANDRARAKDAAFAAELAWKNALGIDPRLAQQAADGDKTTFAKAPPELPIAEREQKMLAAFDVYAGFLKSANDDELLAMRFARANVDRRYHHFDEAIDLLTDLVDKRRDHAISEFAAVALLDTFERLKRSDAMMAVAERLLADRAYIAQHPDLKAKCEQLEARSASR